VRDKTKTFVKIDLLISKKKLACNKIMCMPGVLNPNIAKKCIIKKIKNFLLAPPKLKHKKKKTDEKNKCIFHVRRFNTLNYVNAPIVTLLLLILDFDLDFGEVSFQTLLSDIGFEKILTK
jgi:hypothetical protein